MESMKVSVRPPDCQRFALAPWKVTLQQKPTRKREIRSQIPLTHAAAHNIIVQDPHIRQKINSAATTLHLHHNPFDELPDVFPTKKNNELPPLRPGMDHKILLINHDLVVRPRPIKPKE